MHKRNIGEKIKIWAIVITTLNILIALFLCLCANAYGGLNDIGFIVTTMIICAFLWFFGIMIIAFGQLVSDNHLMLEVQYKILASLDRIEKGDKNE